MTSTALKPLASGPGPGTGWPCWSRKIQMAGGLAVGADILFGEPDSTSPRVLKQTMKHDLNIDIGFQGLPAQLMDNDAVFRDVLAGGPFVLGYSFYFQKADIGQDKDAQIPPFRHAVVREPKAGSPLDYTINALQVVPPLPKLMDSGVNAGFMNTQTDLDGVLRRVPLVMSWNGKLYPHLSLVTLIQALKGRIGDPVIKVSPGGISSMKIGKTVIPLERNGAMLINYRGPAYTFPFISAGHVLEGKIAPDALKNKLIFLGSSAAGLMDIRVSPLAEVFPGVEVNATVADNILAQDFIRRPDWVPGMELLIICLWGLITTVFIGWAGAGLTLASTLVLGVGAWGGGAGSPEVPADMGLPPVPPHGAGGEFLTSQPVEILVFRAEKAVLSVGLQQIRLQSRGGPDQRKPGQDESGRRGKGDDHHVYGHPEFYDPFRESFPHPGHGPAPRLFHPGDPE